MCCLAKSPPSIVRCKHVAFSRRRRRLEKSAIFNLFWVRNKTKKLSSRKFYIELRQLSNLLASWEGDSCSSSNQVLRVRESRFVVFIIKSNQSQKRLLNFEKKKPAKQTLIKRGEDGTRNWPPVTSFHTKEALRGRDPRETQKDTNSS